jgi:ABC-type glycerol-3-phosphate transport system substrate-binding protein
MLRKLGLLLAVLVLAFGVVACGGDDEEPASDSTTTTETTDDSGTTEDTSTTEDTGTTEDSGDVSDNPQVKAAVEQCKQAIQAQPQLSDSLKDDLETLCDKAASGDPQDAQEASVEVCKKIAEEMVPDESVRQQVIDQCEQAVSTTP